MTFLFNVVWVLLILVVYIVLFIFDVFVFGVWKCIELFDCRDKKIYFCSKICKEDFGKMIEIDQN